MEWIGHRCVCVVCIVCVGQLVTYPRGCCVARNKCGAPTHPLFPRANWPEAAAHISRPAHAELHKATRNEEFHHFSIRLGKRAKKNKIFFVVHLLCSHLQHTATRQKAIKRESGKPTTCRDEKRLRSENTKKRENNINTPRRLFFNV